MEGKEKVKTRTNEKGHKEYHLTCQRLVPWCDTNQLKQGYSVSFESLSLWLW